MLIGSAKSDEAVGIGIEQRCELKEPRLSGRIPSSARKAPGKVGFHADGGNRFLAFQRLNAPDA
jgi:hypothetical protein